VRIPVEGGIVLKTRETYPRTSRLFCARADEGWPAAPEIVEAHPVRSVRRRGRAVDVVLDRARMNRSQFVFTNLRGGREAIFWQTQQTARRTKPGARMPKRRASGLADLKILVDSRERYGYRFNQQQATTEKIALGCGDYAVTDDTGAVVAAVERKSLEDLVATVVDGTLQFRLADLSDLPRACVVVDGEYAELLRLEHTKPGFVLETLARLQVRYREVPIVFTGSRKLGEEYTFRFLGAALLEATDPNAVPRSQGPF
jgi:hypothetical protein